MSAVNIRQAISTAAKWMEQGISESSKCRSAFTQTKIYALNAGYYFMQARAALPGEFEKFCEGYGGKISHTSIYRYITFTEEALQWAAAENASLRDNPAALLKAAHKLILQSPKPFIALMRQLGEMRKFGEYDEVKYAQRKLGQPQQIELPFAKVFSTVELLTHFGDENFSVVYPEGKDEVEAMTELEAKLEAALARVRQIKQNGRVIET